MNPNFSNSATFTSLLKSLWYNRSLIIQMTKREVAGRYKGSAIGWAWSFFNPLLMLAVYTFFFSFVFKTRWPGGAESKTEFALVLFSGLMLFNFFSECINRSPTLILSNVNYVKKVIFPLEILPVIALGSAAVHFAISIIVWIVFYVLVRGLPPVTILILPIIIIPLLLISLGMSWLIASLGVYSRDVAQIVGVCLSILMFLSPIFYPVSVLPVEYQPFLLVNPLTLVIEQARDVMLWSKWPDWLAWSRYLLCSVFFCWIGFAWFQKTREGFADVL